VRLSTPGNAGSPSRLSADSMTMRAISLRNCIQVAWQLLRIPSDGDQRSEVMAISIPK